MRRLLSVVVSVYNEEEALAQFYQVTEGILNTISWDYELVFVNDGSRDQSLSILNRSCLTTNRLLSLIFQPGFFPASFLSVQYNTRDLLLQYTARPSLPT